MFARPIKEAKPKPAQRADARNAVHTAGPRSLPQIRPALEVGAADDPLERQADRLAEQVLSGAPPAAERTRPPGGDLGGYEALRSTGRPLGAAERAYFEPRFGLDFSSVRIHDGAAADRVARNIGAQAFAVGSDIGFAVGRHDPGGSAGRRLLAHELAHVALGHHGARRKADGPIVAGPEPEPELTDPIAPSAKALRFQGVIVDDNVEFMREELRRLIANSGLDAAEEWVQQLVKTGGWGSQPLDSGEAFDLGVQPLQKDVLSIPLPSGEFITRKKESQRRVETRAEQSRAAEAAKAIPSVQAAFAQVKPEAIDFLKAFEETGIAVTKSVLTESEAKAEAERLRYGLERTETIELKTYQTEAGERTYQNKSFRHSMENQLPGQGLAGAARDLLHKQREVRQLESQPANQYQGGSGEPWEVEYSPLTTSAEHLRQVAKKQAELSLLQGVYQQRYPILASIGEDDVALEQVASGPSAQTAELLNKQIFGTLGNIAAVREQLGPDGKVQIWKLPDIVALAKEASGCNDPTPLGRMKTRLVDDKIKQVESDEFWSNMALNVLIMGLAVVAALPTGGTSLAAGAAAVAGLGAFTLSALQAGKQIERYQLDKAMSGTDLDKARAIGASEPSLLWLAVDIVGALVDLGPALKGGREMLTLGRTAFQSMSGAAKRLIAGPGPGAAARLEELRQLVSNIDEAGGLGGRLTKRVIDSAERLAESGASVEKSLAGAAGYEAKAVKAGVEAIEKEVAKALAKSPARLGGHTVSVTPGGWLVRCSSCGTLRAEFAVELGRDKALALRMLEIEDKAALAARTGDKALAKQAAEEASAVADRLEAIRRVGNIRAYRDVDLGKIDDIFLMDERLVVDMNYVGKQAKKKKKGKVTAQGWARDPKFYWNEMLERHSEAFSDANKIRMKAGSPVNDEQFYSIFSQYDIPELRNQVLVHHHIGGGGQAAAIPESLHIPKGTIHSVEKAAGIWGLDKVYTEVFERLLGKGAP